MFINPDDQMFINPDQMLQMLQFHHHLHNLHHGYCKLKSSSFLLSTLQIFGAISSIFPINPDQMFANIQNFPQTRISSRSQSFRAGIVWSGTFNESIVRIFRIVTFFK